MPLAVSLSDQTISEINRAMAAVHGSDPARDVEIGGILLGSFDVSAGAQKTVRIERFDPLVSEHRRGSSYVLSDRDKKVLARKLDWWTKHGHKKNLQPVGFFRSHTRRGLYLDNDDFILFQHFFPEPAVFLLVRPTAGAESVGGFFFWEEGDVHREASYQEFSFRPDRLPLTEAPSPEPAPVFQQTPPPRLAERVIRVMPAAPPLPVPTPAIPAATPSPGVPASTMLGPAMPSPAGRRVPFWVQVTIPIGVGVALGAAIFAFVTQGTAPQKPPVAAAPVRHKSTTPTPAPQVVEKPSPLEANSRPVVVAANLPVPEPPRARPKPAAMPARPTLSPQTPSPTGSASRTDAAAASGPVTAVVAPAPAPAPPPVAEATPSPSAAPMAPITAPARVERHIRPPSVARVTVEPVSGSKIGRVVSRIPGFRHRQKTFVPARPLRQVTPTLPADERLTRDVPVYLRVTVDPAGNVTDVEQASHGADRQLVRLASDAARNWHFAPARRNDETVTSELILHFTFPGSER